MPDFNQARQYASQRLANELAPTLAYHTLTHTSHDVVPAAERLARMLGVSHDDMLLVRTAAWYHDLGFVEQREEHEAAGVRLTEAVLPRFGYTPPQVAAISGIIRATRLPQEPRTLLEEILADADLDSLGRTDFLGTSFALRAELATLDTPIPLLAWCQRQTAFLTSHRYFTAAARALRDPGKRRNLARLRTLQQLAKTTKQTST